MENVNLLLKSIKPKVEVLEDNGGGLALFVFGEDGKAKYAHVGYEFFYGLLTDDLKELANGGDPIVDGWDGNWEDPQGLYEELENSLGVEIIADNNGIYPEKMGASGRLEFIR